MASTQNNNISTRVTKFLQQKADHDWLLVPLNCKSGKDEFKNTVVYSRFPPNTKEADLFTYIDMMFNDLPEAKRKKIKAAFLTNSQSFQEEDIEFDYATKDGKISAALIQVIAQRNEVQQFEVLIGVISLVRTPEVGWQFNNDYWQSDKARAKRGLQYVFGTEAQKELFEL